jgi:hypothetical protein
MDSFKIFISSFFASDWESEEISIPTELVDEDKSGGGGGSTYCVIA